jgi:hypothetical protein
MKQSQGEGSDRYNLKIAELEKKIILENPGKMRSIEDKNKIATKFVRNTMISSKVKLIYRVSSSRARRRS